MKEFCWCEVRGSHERRRGRYVFIFETSQHYLQILSIHPVKILEINLLKNWVIAITSTNCVSWSLSEFFFVWTFLSPSPKRWVWINKRTHFKRQRNFLRINCSEARNIYLKIWQKAKHLFRTKHFSCCSWVCVRGWLNNTRRSSFIGCNKSLPLDIARSIFSTVCNTLLMNFKSAAKLLKRNIPNRKQENENFARTKNNEKCKEAGVIFFIHNDDGIWAKVVGLVAAWEGCMKKLYRKNSLINVIKNLK